MAEKGHGRRRRLAFAAASLLVPLLASWSATAPSAVAAPPAAWAIRIVPQPTHFSSAHDAQCEKAGGKRCDGYTLLVTNVGGTASGPLTIADTLSAGVALEHMNGEDPYTGVFLPCTEALLECTDPSVAPGHTVLITIYVTVLPGAPSVIVDHASVAGGGAPAVAATVSTTVSSSPPPFGVAD